MTSSIGNLWPLFMGLVFIGLIVFELKKRQMRWLIVPRLIWLTGALFLLLDLHFISSREYSEPSELVILWDESDSVFGVPERKTQLVQALEELKEWAKENSYPLRFFSFGEGLQRKEAPSDSQGVYRSRIEGLSSQIEEDLPVVIFSDGNFQVSERIANPFILIGLGEEAERDIWLNQVPGVMTAFLKNRLLIPVEIAHSGFEGKEIQVRLFRGEDVIEEQSLVLEAESSLAEFQFFPDKMGELNLAVQIEAVDGELSVLNNTVPIQVRVVRDKIRVLHIGGKPSLDLKAWRLFLTRQPDVDLVSFYILRSLDDDPQAGNNELSLIPFPYDELFTVELDKFDIVILQNFDFNLYFQPFYLRNLARFVRGGGALLMFGGDQSFHRYAFSPLAEVLPFILSPSANLLEKSFAARVAQNHPILDDLHWAFDGLIWGSRHDISLHPNAEALVSFPDGVPLVAIREAGQGRVLAINTDETWRMQFESYGKYNPLPRFARRSLQYLTFDPAMEPESVESPEWRVGTEILLKNLRQQPTPWAVKRMYWQPDYKSDSSGPTQNFSYRIPSAGIYKVDRQIGEAPVFFETLEKPWQSEWKNLMMNRSGMQKLAKTWGGQYLDYENRDRIAGLIEDSRQLISAESLPWLRSSKGLSMLVLLVILSFLSLDFFLRKRFHWDS